MPVTMAVTNSNHCQYFMTYSIILNQGKKPCALDNPVLCAEQPTQRKDGPGWQKHRRALRSFLRSYDTTMTLYHPYFPFE